MGHPLRWRSGHLIMYALLAGVTGGYQQHVPSVLPGPLSSSSRQFGLPQAIPSRSRGAFMWTPTWRAPVTVQTWAPRRERRRPIFMWLFTSIRGVASLPVRVSVVMVRAMRSMCLYLRQSWSALSWSARYDRSLPASNRYDRSLPASKASLPPSPAQQRVRDARLQTLIRLDQESLVSSLTKCACPRHAAAEPRPAFLRPPSPIPATPWPSASHAPSPACASQDAARPDKASR